MAALFLLALSAVVLLKSIALDVNAVRLTSHRIATGQLTDGMIRLAIRHLSVNPPFGGKSGDLRVDGIPLSCRMSQHLVSISFLDTDGLINLNRAPHALLERAFAGAGSSPDEARRLAENVIDFRSAGSDRVSGTTKLEQYQLAGLSHGPKTLPFDTTGELDQVAGMTPALLARVRPLVTVHSRFGTINPRVASLPVLQALASDGISPGERPTAELIDDLRSKVTIPTEFTYIPTTRSVRQTTSNIYIVRVVVEQPGSVRFGRQATIELDPGNQYAIIKAWGDVDQHTLAATMPGPTDAAACVGGLLRLDAPLR